MAVKIKQSRDLQVLFGLHLKTFPQDEWEDPEDTTYWIAYQSGAASGGPAGELTPVGFCSVKDVGDKTLYLTRVGVLPEARGQGLQRHLMKAARRWAKRRGYTTMITYTLVTNYPSITNMIRDGWNLYDPTFPWVGSEVFYYRYDLQ